MRVLRTLRRATSQRFSLPELNKDLIEGSHLKKELQGSLRRSSGRWPPNLPIRRSKGWLTTQVKERLEGDRPPKRRSLFHVVASLVLPNKAVGWHAFVLVAVSIPVSWGLSFWGPALMSTMPGVDVLTPERSRDLLGVLWQVHVAVAAVALPILVFTIDQAGNRPGVAATTQEVLIRESYILQILAAGLALTVRAGIDFVWFAQPAVLVLDLAIVSVLILFTVLAFIRSLRLTFSRAQLQQKALSLLEERMNQVVEASLKTRVANGMLLEWGADFGLGYEPLSNRGGPDSYVNINATCRGRIQDFQLHRIRRLIESLPRVAARPSPSSNVFDLPEEDATDRPPKIIWLRKRVGDVLTDDSPEILRINESGFEMFDRSDFEETLSKSINVESENEVDDATELRSQIAFLRDSLTDAINGGRAGQVEDILSIYRTLSETFLLKLRDLEGSYTSALMDTQESWLYARGWAEVDWIMGAVREAIDDATSSENPTILLDVLFLPTRLADTAFRFRDLKMFHSFIGLIQYAYWTLAPRPDDRVRALGTDRAGRYLSERLNLYLLPAIEEADSALAARTVQPFAEVAMSQFSRLLKEAYEARRLDDFNEFAGFLRSVLRYRHDRTGELDNAKWRLESGDLGEEEEDSLQQDVAILESLDQIATELALRKTIIQCGLAAWIVFDYSTGRREGEDAVPYWDLLELPDDIQSLWHIVRRATTHGEWDDLDWTSWELGVKEEGEAHFIEINSYLYLTFLLVALSLIAKGDGSTMPDSDELRYLAKADGQLIKQLREIEEDAEKWKQFIDEAAVGAIPVLRERLLEAGQKAEEKERQTVVDAPLDPEKTGEVLKRIEEGWREESLLRRLSDQAGAYHFVDQPPPSDVLAFGLNQLDTKHAYITETEVFTMDWGKEWGRSLARGENEMAMSILQNRLPLFEDTSLATDDATASALALLRKQGLEPVILINRSWQAESALERSSNFEWPQGKEDPDLVGFLNKTPVYNLHTKGLEEVVIVDLNAAFEWTQYRAPDLANDQVLIQEIVAIAVESFNETKAQQLIDKWSEEDRKTDLTVESLLERVGLRVFEHFEIQWREATAGIRVPARDRA